MNFSELGKSNKKKGKRYEKRSADFWSERLGGKVIPTPGSGSMMGLPGDLVDIGRENTILKDFVVDVKTEKGMMSKKSTDAYKKNEEDAERKPSFIEVYDNIILGPSTPDVYIIISRRDFSKILVELQGYRSEEIN